MPHAKQKNVSRFHNMAFKSVLSNLPKIFDKAERKRVFGQVAIRSARQFKEYERQQILNAKPSGRLYQRRSGTGFTRSHKASAKGERFATDTGQTLASLTAERTGDLSAVTEFKSKTAEFLLEMDRVVIGPDDEKEAQRILDQTAENVLKDLV